MTSSVWICVLSAEIRQRGVQMKAMPMGTPSAMAMTPVGARPPMGPGGTPVGKGAQQDL